MQCPNCSATVPEGAHFCGSCGTPIAAASPAPPPPAEPSPFSPPGAEVPPAPPTAPTAPVPPLVAPPPPPPTEAIAGVPGAMPPPPPPPPPAPTGFGPPPGGQPIPPYVATEEKRKRNPLPFVLLGLLAVGALVAGVLALTGGDDTASGTGLILLEPANSTLENDFAGNLDADTPGSNLAFALRGLPPLGRGIASALAGLQASGDEPGLFGGSRDVAVCDVEQLIDFLTDEDNADKAAAWAEVQGIDVDEIEGFIRGLTPVRLRFDTRVTNHGFSSGSATPIQSILEAGTAVLVDDEGVPRVKCNCGNPLDEPEDLGTTPEDAALDVDALAENPEDAWDAFDPESVVTIEPGDPVDTFVLVDLDSGELFERPVGTNGEADVDASILDDLCDVFASSPSCAGDGGDDTTTTTDGGDDTTTTDDGTTTTIELGTGDVQVTVQWRSDADLDLAVTEPSGERVDFANPGPTGTGGELDVDSNVGCTNTGSIENVFWPPGVAPSGTYSVEVNGFSVDTCGGGDYVLTIRVNGQEDQVIQDSVGENETDTFTFVVP